jgi:two-component system, NtrC family, response regulator GlrR
MTNSANNVNLFLLVLSESEELGSEVVRILAEDDRISVHKYCESLKLGASQYLKDVLTWKEKQRFDLVVIVSSSVAIAKTEDIFSPLINEWGGVPVMLVSDCNHPLEMLQRIEDGASDYVVAPLRSIDVLPRVWKLVDHGKAKTESLQTLLRQIGLREMIGDSPEFRRIIGMIPEIAHCDVGVLISGETGTGKEMCARAIHYLGPRTDKPFIPVNCSGFPADLVENELFGHIKGAFTGAATESKGLVGESEGGTLFLDEIDCLPLLAQAKVLRLLQEKEYRHLGSARTVRADIRIIAASNINLARGVEKGTFRADLFYRLNTIHLQLPALRERKEDIVPLARHFLRIHAPLMNKHIEDFDDAAKAMMRLHEWPGNIRELENVTKRSILFAKDSIIHASDLGMPQEITNGKYESLRAQKAKVLSDFECRYLRDVLELHDGNITRAAKAAQKNRRAFWELLRKYHIDVGQFRHPSLDDVDK